MGGPPWLRERGAAGQVLPGSGRQTNRACYANTRITKESESVIFESVGPILQNVGRPMMGTLAFGRDWWLPTNYAEHGASMDTLFNVIFWMSVITFVGVFAAMIYFCIRYRHQAGKKKAVFTHGNTRLEMIWTLIPAVILIVLAVFSKRVWDNYRYADTIDKSKTAKILVIGQQFNWNVIYPGPDGKIGRYLQYPHVTDLKWPEVPASDTYVFPNVPGPAYLPEAQARKILKDYIESVNPLGKDFSDPDGKDDDYQKTPGREINVPKGRTVEVALASRDVIHDFFLPNFRVKLDAVPGMRGILYFTPMKTSAEVEKETRREYTLDELQGAIGATAAKKRPDIKTLMLAIPENDPRVNTDATGRRYAKEIEGDDPDHPGKKMKTLDTIVREDSIITDDVVTDLRAAGFTKVTAYTPATFDLVCEQLCGAGHYTMKGALRVIEPEEWHTKFETAQAASAPEPAAPAAAVVAKAGTP